MSDQDATTNAPPQQRPSQRVRTTVDDLRLWQRFHIRLSFIYAATVFVAVLITGGLFYYWSLRVEIETLQAKLSATTVALAQGISAELVQNVNGPEDRHLPGYADLELALANVARAENDFLSVYVLKPTEDEHTLRFVADWARDGQPAQVGERYAMQGNTVMARGLTQPAVETEPIADIWGLSLSGYAPILDTNGNSVGLVGADIHISRIDAIRARLLATTAAVYGGAIILLVCIAWLVGRNVRKPLSRIIASTTAIADGDYQVRSDLRRQDEFGILGRHFDAMAAGLEEREFIRATFGRYVSEDVATAVLADHDAAALGGEEREVTVLFSDLRGYSTLSERLTPSQIVELLNAYLSAMGEVIDRHAGVVIEFLGDAILAVFNAPNRLPHHPELAVRCALEMSSALAKLNAEWIASGFSATWRGHDLSGPPLGARIGIHTGRVVAGNLGSKTRVKYAVIGDAVNVAARVESLNKSLRTEVLITAQTYAGLPEPLRERARDMGEHNVKGRSGTVRVYTFSDLATPEPHLTDGSGEEEERRLK